MTTLNTRQETELIMQTSRNLAAISIEGRVLGPERLARHLGVVAIAAQDRALALMDEQRGNELPEASAREARELIPGVAVRRYEAPEPLAVAQSHRQAMPLPPPWLAANDLDVLAATWTCSLRPPPRRHPGGQMASFGSEFGTRGLGAVEFAATEHVSGEPTDLRKAA